MEQGTSQEPEDFGKASTKAAILAIYGVGTAAIVAGIVAANTFFPTSVPTSREIFSGPVNGRIVSYQVAQYGWFRVRRSCDTMLFYDSGGREGQSELSSMPTRSIEDCDENGAIGNVGSDNYVIYLKDGRKIIYAKDYVVDEEGRRFSIDGDKLEQKVVEVGKQKLEEVTRLYQETKSAVQNELESRLKQELAQ